jgi:hypothetical protein
MLDQNIPTSAAEARRLNAKYYFTGMACPKGHVTVRVTRNQACAACRQEYNRQAYQKNPEATRLRSRKRYKNNPQKFLANNEKWRKKQRLLEPWNLPLKSAKERAKKKGLIFTLSKKWAAEIWTGKCSLSGLDFDLVNTQNGGGPFSPSLDRIDNLLGYSPENSRFVLSCINNFKSSLSDAEVLRIAKAILACPPGRY